MAYASGAFTDTIGLAGAMQISAVLLLLAAASLAIVRIDSESLSPR
jgi:hypothetical protein